MSQPPSGGCVLKLFEGQIRIAKLIQPPSGGCVLKLTYTHTALSDRAQPPSGGCVLKPDGGSPRPLDLEPAAFGRLCVETAKLERHWRGDGCPAAFGRLCVETLIILKGQNHEETSRLRAAVC